MASGALVSLCVLAITLACNLVTSGGEASPQESIGRDQLLLLQKQLSISSDSARGGLDAFDPAFFDEYALGESTYDEQAMPLQKEELLNHFVGYSSSSDAVTIPKEFFAETGSAGALDAWQTYFPKVGDVPMNRLSPDTNWVDAEEGFVEKYITDKTDWAEDKLYQMKKGMVKQADWFDASISNYNGLGQQHLPKPGTGKSFLDALPGEEWIQRAVNTTVACQAAGCTATSLLQVFDPAVEEARLCKLSIEVHPTDYDNDWSREFIKSWRVNGRVATGRCNPYMMGCNSTAWRPLVHCLQDLEVDDLLSSSNGSLIIEGTINKLVDECPYEGNLLSGVASVTCMARDLAVPVTRPAPEDEPPQPHDLCDELLPGCVIHSSAALQCRKPGCVAQTLLALDSDVVLAGAWCSMNVSVVQTDFDNSVEGSTEQIEYIAIEGLGNISTNVTPGMNPCTQEYSTGETVPRSNRTFQVITDFNVSAGLLALPVGDLLITGKISRQVDDCASDGFLLNGKVTVKCEIPVPEGYEVSSTSSTTGKPLAAIEDFNIAAAVKS